jgi:hypothetical protein
VNWRLGRVVRGTAVLAPWFADLPLLVTPCSAERLALNAGQQRLNTVSDLVPDLADLVD